MRRSGRRTRHIERVVVVEGVAEGRGPAVEPARREQIGSPPEADDRHALAVAHELGRDRRRPSVASTPRSGRGPGSARSRIDRPEVLDLDLEPQQTARVGPFASTSTLKERKPNGGGAVARRRTIVPARRRTPRTHVDPRRDRVALGIRRFFFFFYSAEISSSFFRGINDGPRGLADALT